MTRKLHFCLLTTIFCIILTSCSKENGTTSLIEDKLESMSGKEILRELLIKNDNDINQLARIFDCSPSSLKRILGGETITTEEGKNQFKNVLKQTLITDEKTLDELDPLKQKWYYKTRAKYSNPYYWGITIVVVILITIFTKNDNLIIWVPILSLFGYIIALLVIWYKGDPTIIDDFKNTFDPIWEIPR